MGNSSSTQSTKHPPPSTTPVSPAHAAVAAQADKARIPPPTTAAAVQQQQPPRKVQAPPPSAYQTIPGRRDGKPMKNKSLELPDFAPLTRRAPSFVPSQPIAIPGSAPPTAKPPDAQDLPDIVQPAAHPVRRPMPTLSPVHTQETLDQTGKPSRTKKGAFGPMEFVQSSVPIGLDVHAEPILSPEQREVPATITWQAGGADVWVEDRWNGRTRLTYDPVKRRHTVTLRLPIGNHTIQFIVDDQPRLSPDLPTATDPEGSLVNYITVASPPAPASTILTTTNTTTLPGPAPGPSSAGGPIRQVDTWDDEDAPPPGHVHPPMLYSASTWLRERTESYGPSADGSGGSPPWTSSFPPHLIAAQAEEERFLQFRERAARDHSARETLPAPPPVLPPAPTLPRHLDKMILSMRAKAQALPPPPKAPRRSKSGLAPPPLTQVRAPPDGGDDESVLPIPSHVVLHHLGTSPIRNGVLAVADTTRYKRKYITTIYYKPLPIPAAQPGQPAPQPAEQ